MKFYDLCCPAGNELELISRARELGYFGLVFLYEVKSAKELLEKKKEVQALKPKLEIKVGICFRPKKVSEVKKFADKLFLEADFIAASAQNDKIIRALVEQPRIDAIFSIARETGGDHPNFRRSGFNQILLNLAKKSKIAYSISLSRLLELSGQKRAKLLGREAQNVRICRGRIPVILASFAKDAWQLRKPEDLASLGCILGLNAPLAKVSVSKAIFDILQRKKARRSKEFVRPGVRVVG